ncbi:MAG: potassium channel protein [Desulfarculus sp.]|nr:potassium channel protein [Desulfarculus sp.]
MKRRAFVLFDSQVALALTTTLLVLAGGTAGYMLIEGWDFHDSLFMTITTVATVGYGEVHPLSRPGEIFSMALILVGVGSVLYFLTMITQWVVEGKLRQVMGRRSLERKIRSLKDHYIICGYGRIGAQVADMLAEKNVGMVVIDTSEEATRRLEAAGIHYVLGSATEDESLLAAGIDRARGLVATVSSDADNVYIVLTARGMRPDLFIIARATEPGSERKLKRAGADKVVSPYFIGARRIAQTVLRPSVADFIDLTFHGSDLALQMEELVVGQENELVGVSLKESGLRQKLDLIILAIKKADDRMIFNPPADTVIDRGDTLIAMGPHESMVKLARMLAVES